MKNTILLLSTVLYLFSSCKGIKMMKLMTKGEVQEGAYLSEIPFEFSNGLIIIEATIKGEKYDFLYDTGAPNVISKELAAKLNIKPYVVNKTSDSQGKKEDLEYVFIDQINIGDIEFKNTGAAIADLKRSSVIACLNVDGIIGANLMQKAIWQIDYEERVLRISNTIDSFNIENGEHIKFNQKLTGTPIVDIKVNGVVAKNVTIDTGSNGDFGFSVSTFNQINDLDSSASSIYGVGTTTSGLYGVGAVDTVYYSKLSTVSFGDIELQNQSANFRKQHAVTVGNEFFENYDVTYNWFEKEMILTNKKEADISSFNSFGFSYFYSNDKLVVSIIIQGSDAESKGLKRGEQIVNINGEDYARMTQEKWCELLDKDILRNSKSIDITILRDSQEVLYQLEKKDLLAH